MLGKLVFGRCRGNSQILEEMVKVKVVFVVVVGLFPEVRVGRGCVW